MPYNLHVSSCHHIDDSIDFIMTPLSGPGDIVTVHCISGSQSGKYLKINSGGMLVTGKDVGPGEENRFARTPHLSVLDGIRLEKINTNEIVAFDQSGHPIWVTNPNDERTCLELISGFIRPAEADVEGSTIESNKQEKKMDSFIQLPPSDVGTTE